MHTNKLLLTLQKAKKIHNYIKKHPQKAVVICYIAVAVAVISSVLFVGLINFVLFKVGYFTQLNADVNSFEQVGIEVVDETTFITVHDDSQLILSGANIRSLHAQLSFSQPPGEVVAFYTLDGSQNFGMHQMLYGKLEDGAYSFYFPMGTTSIRLDCGVTASNTIYIDYITINRALFKDLVPFNGAVVFLILVLPMIILPLFYYVGELFIKK